MKVALLGAGSWGTALARVLLENRHALFWWVHRPEIAEKLRSQGRHPSVFPDQVLDISALAWVGTEVAEALAEAEAVVLALPSQYVELVLEGRDLPEVVWISCTKGLLPGGLRLPRAYLLSQGLSRVAILSGPSHAEEVILHKPTWVGVGAPDLESWRISQALFQRPYFHLLHTTQVAPLEWVGILKNIYTLALGVAAAWGDNARAAVAALALGELERVLRALAPQSDFSFFSPPWAGDFLVTAFSAYSRNQRFGQLLAQGYSPTAALYHLGMVAEGFYAAQSLRAWEGYTQFPLLRGIIDAVHEGAGAGERLRSAILQIMR